MDSGPNIQIMDSGPNIQIMDSGPNIQIMDSVPVELVRLITGYLKFCSVCKVSTFESNLCELCDSDMCRNCYTRCHECKLVYCPDCTEFILVDGMNYCCCCSWGIEKCGWCKDNVLVENTISCEECSAISCNRCSLVEDCMNCGTALCDNCTPCFCND